MVLMSDILGFNLFSLHVRCQNKGDTQTTAHLEDDVKMLNHVVFTVLCYVIHMLQVNSGDSHKQ